MYNELCLLPILVIILALLFVWLGSAYERMA